MTRCPHWLPPSWEKRAAWTPEAQWDWHVGWALISVRFPRLRPPGCCGRGSARSRSTARRRGQSVTPRTTAPRSGSRSWLTSAHGNWLPRPKAQARRRKHPPGPPPTAGRPGNASAWSRSSTARRRAGHSRRGRPVPAARSRRICADYLGRDPLRPGPSLPAAPPGRAADELVLPARLAGEVAPVILAWAASPPARPTCEAPAPSSPVGTGRRAARVSRGARRREPEAA